MCLRAQVGTSTFRKVDMQEEHFKRNTLIVTDTFCLASQHLSRPADTLLFSCALTRRRRENGKTVLVLSLV